MIDGMIRRSDDQERLRESSQAICYYIRSLDISCLSLDVTIVVGELGVWGTCVLLLWWAGDSLSSGRSSGGWTGRLDWRLPGRTPPRPWQSWDACTLWQIWWLWSKVRGDRMSSNHKSWQGNYPLSSGTTGTLLHCEKCIRDTNSVVPNGESGRCYSLAVWNRGEASFDEGLCLPDPPLSHPQRGWWASGPVEGMSVKKLLNLSSSLEYKDCSCQSWKGGMIKMSHGLFSNWYLIWLLVAREKERERTSK